LREVGEGGIAHLTEKKETGEGKDRGKNWGKIFYKARDTSSTQPKGRGDKKKQGRTSDD